MSSTAAVIRLTFNPVSCTQHASMADADRRKPEDGQKVLFVTQASDLLGLSTAEIIAALNGVSVTPIKTLHTKKAGLERLWTFLNKTLATTSALPDTIEEDTEVATAKKAKKAAKAAKAPRTPKAPKAPKKERPLLNIKPGKELKAVRKGSFLAWLVDKLTRANGMTRKEFLAEQAEREITQSFARWVKMNLADRCGYGIEEVEKDRFIAVLPKGTEVPKHKAVAEAAE